MPGISSWASVGPNAPSTFEWVVAVVCLVIQQDGAFVSLPLVAAGESLRATVNPANTVAITVCSVLITLVFLPQSRRVALLARHNLTSVLFLVLVLLSTVWSIHPDITVRRGAGYVLTIAFAGYLVVRFNVDNRMRALSASFAVSAVGSVVFVALFPNLGIMHFGELAGSWRGVFPHKNVLGPIMALAVFVELYVILTARRRPWWRFALLSLYAALVVLSHSATAMLLSLLYAGGAALYLLWRRNRVVALAAAVNGVLVLVAAAIILHSDVGSALGVIGKDPTLTGRTTLWDVVLAFIKEKPVLGWGYQAMWVVGDPTTTYADRVTGNWGVTSSHNAFLEITLQLGLIGTGAMFAIIGTGFVRACRCCRTGSVPLGWFALVYFGGATLAAQTIDTLGKGQAIEWIVFNLLLFGCGQELARWRHAHSPRGGARWVDRSARDAGVRASTPVQWSGPLTTRPAQG
jgi:exopolysaccharide production protein ExoQ